jgi:hypothetical protein
MTANPLDSRIRALVVEVAETSPAPPAFDELVAQIAVADPASPSKASVDQIGGWKQGRTRTQDRRRRQQLTATAAVLGVSLTLVAGLVALTNGSAPHHSVVATPPTGSKTSHPAGTTAPPTSIVAHIITPIGAGYTSEIVELAARDGHLRRVLAQVPSGLTVYSVTADQGSVYLDGFNPLGGVPCPSQAKARASVLRVPRRGGQAVLATTGARPVLSPDASKLAYIRSDCGTTSESFVPEHLAVRQLATGAGTGTERLWSLPPPYTDGNTGGFENIGPPEWAADGTHLLLRVVSGGQTGTPPAGPTTWWYIDTAAPSGNLHAVQLPITAGPQGPVDIIPLGHTGRWAALLPGQHPGDALRIVNYNPVHAATGRELTRFQPPTNATVHLVDADASGQHLLLLVTTGGSENQPQTTDLYTSSPGQAQPTQIAHNVVAATW